MKLFCSLLVALAFVCIGKVCGQNNAADSTAQAVVFKQNYIEKTPFAPAPMAGEQDCQSAIAVCQQTYNSNSAPLGSGAVNDLDSTSICLSAGEKNSVWFIFNVQTAGTFGFLVKTNDPVTQIDYDFALWNITGTTCNALKTGLTPVRCNYSASMVNGQTGMDAATAAPGNLSYGPAGAAIMPGINVAAGETYVLLVSRFSVDQLGYVLSFSGTASIFDNLPPSVTSAKPVCPFNNRRIAVTFSEPVSCATVSASDFAVTTQSGQTVTPTAVVCGPGAFSNTIYVEIGAGVNLGSNFTFRITGNITDNCNNPLSVPLTYALSVPTLELFLKEDIGCKGEATGRILVTGTGKAPLIYALNNGAGQTSNVFENLTAGAYTVRVTDGNSCSATLAVTLTEPSTKMTLSLTKTDIKCAGSSGGAITSTVAGGTGLINYSWSNGANTPNLSNLAAGTYTLTVTDALGCKATQSATITTSAPPLAVSGTKTDVACFGGATGSVVLSVTGGKTPYAYLWNNGATTANLSGLLAGTYNVTVTDANACTTTAAFTVAQPAAALQVSLSATNVVCFGQQNGSVTTTVTGGTAPYVYVWNHGASTQNLTNLPPAAYTLTVTDAKGCKATQTATIAQAASLFSVSGVQKNVSCKGAADGGITLTPAGGATPYTFLWNDGLTVQNRANLSGGTYSVTARDAFGCAQTLNFNLLEPAVGLTLTTAVQPLVCGQTLGAIDLTAAGGTQPYAYAWSHGPTTQDVFNLPNGSYSVVVTDANGCKNTLGVSVQKQGQFNLTYNKTDVACFGAATGSAMAVVTGSAPPFTYLWSNGFTGASQLNLPAGTYWVRVTDATLCKDSLSFVINQPAAALSLTSQTVGVGCKGASTGAINLTVSGGTPPYTFLWNNGKTTEDLNGLSAGVYSVSVTDAKGCNAQLSQTITEPAQPLAATAAFAPILCFGQKTNIDLTVSGGTPPYAFQWSNGASTEDLSNVSAGAYSVTVTDANACKTTVAVDAAQPTALSVSGATQAANCSGQNNGGVTLTVAGGVSPYAFLWNNGATTQNLASVSAGNYAVTVTDANGCTATGAYTVSQPALLSLSAGVVSVGCFGGANGAVSLTVGGGTTPYQFQWSHGATSQNISGLNAGTYSVTVTDAKGCSDFLSATVTQPQAPLSATAAVQDAVCRGEATGAVNLSVSGGTPPYAFQWSNGAVTQNLSGVAAGNYQVSIVDAKNCGIGLFVTVGQPAQFLTLSAATVMPSCQGFSDGQINLTVSGGAAPYAFQWNTGAATQNLSNVSAGAYSVTVTDGLGCVKSLNINLQEPLVLTVSSVVKNVNCFGQNDGAIDLTVSGGTPPYVYGWSNGATTEDVFALFAGMYSVTVVDANQCVAQTGAVVTESPSLSLSAAAKAVTCKGGANGSIQLTVSGGTAPYSYSWSHNFTGQNPANLSAGTYVVVVTDGGFCTASLAVAVSEPGAALSATVLATPVACFGAATGATALAVSGGVPPYSFLWNNGATTQNLTNLSAGNYTVVVTDAAGCTQTASAAVSQPAAISLSASAAKVSCFGLTDGAIQLNVAGGVPPYQIVWNNGQTGAFVQGLAAGVYLASVTDANGCAASLSVTVAQPAALNLTATVTNVSCNAGLDGAIAAVVSGGTPPYDYLWSTGHNAPVLANAQAGNYSLTVSDANGCTLSLARTLTEPALPLNLAIFVDSVSCFNAADGKLTPVVSGGTPPYAYSWSNGATAAVAANLAAGTFTLTVQDANLCSVQKTIFLPNPAPLSLSLTKTDALCFGQANGSVQATVTGGRPPYAYNWSSGQTAPAIFDLSAKTYTLTVADSRQCAATVSVTVGQPQPLVVQSVRTNVACFGQPTGAIALNVTGGTPPYAYLWNNGAATPNLADLPAGTYTVAVTDANGCYQAHTAVLSEPLPLNLEAAKITNNLCKGAANGGFTATASGGAPPYVYSLDEQNWQNGGVFTSLLAGNYTVWAQDANGCRRKTTLAITEPDSALAFYQIDVVHLVCPLAQTGELKVQAAGGVPPYQYSIDNGVSFQLNPVFGSLSGKTYRVVARDANGCLTPPQPTLVFEPPAFVFDLKANNVSCQGQADAGLIVNLNGGTPPYLFSVNNSPFAAQNAYPNLPIGQYNVTAQDANGCLVAAEPIFVTEPPLLVLDSVETKDAGCFGENGGSAAAFAAGGSPPYTFWWSFDPQAAAGNGAINLTAGAYSVAVSDANGCVSQPKTFIINEFAEIKLRPDILFCFVGNNAGDLVSLGPASPAGGLWSGKGVLPNTDLFDPALSGLGRHAAVYTANGCQDTVWITVDKVKIESGEREVCLNQNLFPLPLAQPYGGVWHYAGMPNERNLTVDMNLLGAGEHYIYYTTTAGCTDSFMLKIRPVPAARFGFSPPAAADTLVVHLPNARASVADSSVGATSFQWLLGDSVSGSTTINFHFLKAGLYPVQLFVSNEFGCTDTLTKYILVDDSTEILLPNAFSPNGDGLNDEFRVANIELDWHHLQIFHIWDGLVFETETNGGPLAWNGANRAGKPLPPGVYGMVYNARKKDGRTYKLKGMVTLVK